MGAENISFELDGSKTFADVRLAFEDRRRQDAQENGSQQGYSGDFQTVRSVLDHGGMVFDSCSEAEDYCLDKAKKWETVIAVRYRVVKEITLPKRHTVLNDQAALVEDELRKVRKESQEAYEKIRFNTEKMSCRNCGSKLACRFLSMISSCCPVCGISLLAKKDRKRIATLEKKLNIIQENKAKVKAAARAKAVAKSKKTHWLICGWGAC